VKVYTAQPTISFSTRSLLRGPSQLLKLFVFSNYNFACGSIWCETWSLTLIEEYRLRVFENRVLRRIIGPKRDEVIGRWRKLRNEELHNLYSSPSIIRIIK
jgi:hypothetical protein